MVNKMDMFNKYFIEISQIIGNYQEIEEKNVLFEKENVRNLLKQNSFKGNEQQLQKILEKQPSYMKDVIMQIYKKIEGLIDNIFVYHNVVNNIDEYYILIMTRNNDESRKDTVLQQKEIFEEFFEKNNFEIKQELDFDPTKQNKEETGRKIRSLFYYDTNQLFPRSSLGYVSYINQIDNENREIRIVIGQKPKQAKQLKDDEYVTLQQLYYVYKEKPSLTYKTFVNVDEEYEEFRQFLEDVQNGKRNDVFNYLLIPSKQITILKNQSNESVFKQQFQKSSRVLDKQLLIKSKLKNSKGNQEKIEYFVHESQDIMRNLYRQSIGNTLQKGGKVNDFKHDKWNPQDIWLLTEEQYKFIQHKLQSVNEQIVENEVFNIDLVQGGFSNKMGIYGISLKKGESHRQGNISISWQQRVKQSLQNELQFVEEQRKNFQQLQEQSIKVDNVNLKLINQFSGLIKNKDNEKLLKEQQNQINQFLEYFDSIVGNDINSYTQQIQSFFLESKMSKYNIMVMFETPSQFINQKQNSIPFDLYLTLSDIQKSLQGLDIDNQVNLVNKQIDVYFPSQKSQKTEQGQLNIQFESFFVRLQIFQIYYQLLKIQYKSKDITPFGILQQLMKIQLSKQDFSSSYLLLHIEERKQKLELYEQDIIQKQLLVWNGVTNRSIMNIFITEEQNEDKIRNLQLGSHGGFPQIRWEIEPPSQKQKQEQQQLLKS